MMIPVAPGRHTLSLRMRGPGGGLGSSEVTELCVAPGESLRLTCHVPVVGRIKIEQESSPVHDRHPDESTAYAPADTAGIELRETHRTEEFIDHESRAIENMHSRSTSTRTFKLGKKWIKTSRVEWERARAVSGSGGIDAPVLSAKFGVQSAITQRYHLEEGVENSIEGEVSVAIPAYTSTRLILTWKRGWQHGYAIITDEAGSKVEVPFAVCVDATFDQSFSDAVDGLAER